MAYKRWWLWRVTLWHRVTKRHTYCVATRTCTYRCLCCRYPSRISVKKSKATLSLGTQFIRTYKYIARCPWWVGARRYAIYSTARHILAHRLQVRNAMGFNRALHVCRVVFVAHQGQRVNWPLDTISNSLPYCSKNIRFEVQPGQILVWRSLSFVDVISIARFLTL